MSRLVLPVRFADWVDLFSNVKAKHDADGASSVLISFLNENEIDLTVDENALADAFAENVLFEKHERDAEKIFRERDNLFNPVWNDHRACVQFLKKFHRNNTHKLGDYGITVNGKKIAYPRNFENRRLAAIALIEQHLGFVPITNSPLHLFITENEIDLAQNKTDAIDAEPKHTLARKTNRDKETKRAERNIKIKNVKINLMRIGGLLLKLFSNNTKKAGDWGFTVDHSPRKPKYRKTVLNLSVSRTIAGVKIGGVLKVTEGTVSVFKGKTQTGTATILNTGQQMQITKGFSVITVVNTSDINKTRLSLLRTS